MARAKVQLERNAFVRGLITEASPLTFPENASIDERNFILNRDGSRQRRLGMDLENSSVYVDTGKTPFIFDAHNINTFKWDNVSNTPSISLGVIQAGNELWFVDLFSTTLSANVKNGGASFKLDTATIGYNISGNSLMDFASIDGKLVVVSKELTSPLLLEYNSGTDVISHTEIDIKVRDVWGVDDGLDIDERPSTLSDEHNYNLLNQGWTASKITDAAAGGSFGLAGNVYPSNADVMYIARNASGNFDFTILDRHSFGNTPAAKGHYIIDAFSRGADRLAESGITVPSDAESGRVSVVTSFAGRIFYAGIDSSVSGGDDVSPNYAGTIFFSKIIETPTDFGKCYQIADPTSEDDSTLVASDGGFIKIAEAGQVLKLVRKDATLVVICDNGVWQISGPDQVFSADDYSVTQITNVGCISKNSVINAEGNILYWSDGGIYILTPNEVSGMLQAQNLTETSIQTFYNDIPSIGRANAVGNFDVASRKVSWLYNDTDGYDGVSLRKRYNKELTLDTVLQAFYVNEINDAETDSPFIAGYMPTQNFNTLTYQEPVVHNGEQVVVNGEDVVITQTVRSRGVSQTKYLVFKPNATGSNYGMSFAHYINPDFKDWDEVDAAAYLVTGHELFQDTQRKKQVQYLTMHFNRTETGFEDNGDGTFTPINESSCLCQVRWDFSNSSNSGKWGTQFQAYRLRRPYVPTGGSDTFDYGWEVISTKNRLRGSGRALSLRIDSEAGKDLYILGWGMDVDGSSNV